MVVIAKIPRVTEFSLSSLLNGHRTYESVIAFFLLLASNFSQFDNTVLTNFFSSTTIHVNEHNNKFILEYNYLNTLIDLALATVVHNGLRSK